jgi:hypothetical protein
MASPITRLRTVRFLFKGLHNMPNVLHGLTHKSGNKHFKRVKQFKYLGIILTIQNSIHAEIVRECLLSLVQNFLSCSLLPKNVNIKLSRTVILTAVLHGCETWSLTLWEECSPIPYENKVLRRMLGLKRDEITGEWRRLHMEELYALYSPNIVWAIKSRRLR